LLRRIRQTRAAAGLRDLFVDPMVVHGPGPTGAESLKEFIRRVATELEIAPGLAMEPHDCIVAGAKAIYRLSYWHPNPTLSNPSPFARPNPLCVFGPARPRSDGKTALPGGTGWE
jgi:hypothetical protein